ncbi:MULTISPECIES: ABC transporter ATP-binding protein [Micromonospora]|uniref:ABC transporter ATP-binding protein n=1 Tax=Micromonospora TaxID=1873 RepID=UPI0003EEB522|nr:MULTISPECIES: ABC transporter ATP-binding protein [Micromonospora]EWM63278.1 molybdate ABC transporter ATP-binding protein [Micromonospora sp. M42]MCK1805509.1 ABC transporter ATP-binding protein [Micromonospora sp. R42106]MCK1834297.1 ABC transporter ATP-binding protein [Micromonospora sp. R42003]MCK1846250.1 ABC transporter ATP-binding protein [Micromonospora sp. R42004]MCM1018843.1 ABC transporter ATP-binding protein [Micromonospora sp. XM-20-01]
MTALLDAHLAAERDGFSLDVRLRIAAGEVVALLGPNGAGKTTALRVLAGLHPLTAGHLTLDGADLDRPDRRMWTPPERRPVGVVFQDYLLFPHLSALDNVAFGPRRRGADKRAARARAQQWLDRVGLGDQARRRPRQLSGGQAQRVALARALAVDPALLLLDEPLAALDARTRLDTRAELQRHLGAHPGATLLVTHDPLDALVLADRLVIVEHGRVVQEGDAATVTARPRTDYVARLVGLNLHRGRADGHTVTVGELALTTADTVHGDVFVAYPPAAVALHPSRPEGSPRNVWAATVTGVQRHGDNLRVQLAGPVEVAADVTPAAAAHLGLIPGRPVWAAVKAAETRAYPA